MSQLFSWTLPYDLFSGKTHTMYGCRGEEGVIDMAVNQLFYAMEETPNRKFLVMVSSITFA